MQKLGVVLSTQEVNIGELEIQSHPQLHNIVLEQPLLHKTLLKQRKGRRRKEKKTKTGEDVRKEKS